MSGSDIIENMMFIDTDREQVSMKRVIHANGTAELTTTKNGDSSIANLTNHDYNIFYILANPNSKEARENTHIEATEEVVIL